MAATYAGGGDNSDLFEPVVRWERSWVLPPPSASGPPSHAVGSFPGIKPSTHKAKILKWTKAPNKPPVNFDDHLIQEQQAKAEAPKEEVVDVDMSEPEPSTTSTTVEQKTDNNASSSSSTNDFAPSTTSMMATTTLTPAPAATVPTNTTQVNIAATYHHGQVPHPIHIRVEALSGANAVSPQLGPGATPPNSALPLSAHPSRHASFPSSMGGTGGLSNMVSIGEEEGTVVEEHESERLLAARLQASLEKVGANVNSAEQDGSV